MKGYVVAPVEVKMVFTESEIISLMTRFNLETALLDVPKIVGNCEYVYPIPAVKNPTTGRWCNLRHFFTAVMANTINREMMDKVTRIDVYEVMRHEESIL